MIASRRAVAALAVFALLLVGGNGAATGESSRLRRPLTIKQLANGLTVILEEDHHVPLVAVVTQYDIGNAADPPGRGGLAHIFEHLLFQDTRHAHDIATLFASAGSGYSNAWTTLDSNHYEEIVPENQLELALWVEADRMAFADVDESKFATQRSVVVNEARERYESMERACVLRYVQERLYPATHPYHRFVGDPHELASTQPADAVAFYRAHYAPNNAALVLVGDFQTDRALAAIDRYFGSILPRPIEPKAVPPPVVLTTEERLDIAADVESAYVVLVWPTPGEHQAGDFALRLAASVIGANGQSRLSQRLIHDAAIAESVYANLEEPSRYGSMFLVGAEARPGHSLDELVAAIDDELAKLRAAPTSSDELSRVRGPLLLGLVRPLESSLERARTMSEDWQFFGDPEHLPTVYEQFEGVTPESLRVAVDRWLPPHRRLVVRIQPTKGAPICGVPVPAPMAHR